MEQKDQFPSPKVLYRNWGMVSCIADVINMTGNMYHIRIPTTSLSVTTDLLTNNETTSDNASYYKNMFTFMLLLYSLLNPSLFPSLTKCMAPTIAAKFERGFVVWAMPFDKPNHVNVMDLWFSVPSPHIHSLTGLVEACPRLLSPVSEVWFTHGAVCRLGFQSLPGFSNGIILGVLSNL